MKKLWKWAITASALQNKSHEQIASLCNYAGVSALEISWRFTDGKSEQEIKDIRTLYEKAGISLQSFHLPFGQIDDICSFYETLRRQTVQSIEEILPKVSLFGSSIAIIHPTTTTFNVRKEGIENYLSQMGKSLETILPKAEKEGITIAIENMQPGPNNCRFGSQPEHFVLMKEKFAHPNLGFCLDTGHALFAGNNDYISLFLKTMGKNLIHMHLQDNSGNRDSHLAPGRGLVDWEIVFKGMLSMNYSNIACIEAPPFSYGPNNTHSLESWKQLMLDVETLFKESIT